jgi:hypothetical protein
MSSIRAVLGGLFLVQQPAAQQGQGGEMADAAQRPQQGRTVGGFIGIVFQPGDDRVGGLFRNLRVGAGVGQGDQRLQRPVGDARFGA